MAAPKKLDANENPAAPDVAAGHMEEILEQTVLDALNSVKPEQLIGAVPDEELRKGTAYPSSAWLHSPAQLELLAQADERLSRVANMKQTAEANVNLVERVDAKLIPGTKLLVLRPASNRDLTAYPVHRYAGQAGAWINLYNLLKPASLAVDSGYRELYTVCYVPSTSPLWPGLVIDLGKSQDRRREPRRTKGQSQGS